MKTLEYVKLPTDANGYVAGLRCPHPHAGNRRMAQATYWCQCSGCGHIVMVADAARKLKLNAIIP